MPTLIILGTTDPVLADQWEKQLPAGAIALRLDGDEFQRATMFGLAAVVVLDAAIEFSLPPTLVRYPTIYVGEPRTLPFEQARLSKRGRLYLSYEESATRLRDVLPLFEEIAEKQSLVEILTEKNRKGDVPRNVQRFSPADPADLWDFLEGAVENLDTRDRLLGEFRRASRHILHASHAVFFLRETEGFRADRGTSFFSNDDPIVRFFENHPAVIDGMNWDSPADAIGELAVRNRLALWGARLLVPIHDNGRLLGLIALGVRDDGQSYDEGDRNRCVFFARLLRHFLAKSSQICRLSHVANHIALGAKYLPGTLVLGPDDGVPRHVPLVVRDIIGNVRRSGQICRVSPTQGQPFRASAGIISETGGVWAFWEEASSEVHDSLAKERAGRIAVLRELALTLNHELGNALVSLNTFSHASGDRPVPAALVQTVKGDVAQLGVLNDNLALMERLHDTEPAISDLRDIATSVAKGLGIKVEIGPDPVLLRTSKGLIDYTLRAVIKTVAENRPDFGFNELVLKVRSTGTGTDLTALLSLKGKNLELEGILPEPVDGGVPRQGRISVFLAKEILRLHHGEIHAGPGMECVEILISLRSL